MNVYSGPGLFMLDVVGPCLAGGPAYYNHAVNQLVDQYGLSGWWWLAKVVTELHN